MPIYSLNISKTCEFELNIEAATAADAHDIARMWFTEHETWCDQDAKITASIRKYKEPQAELHAIYADTAYLRDAFRPRLISYRGR